MVEEGFLEEGRPGLRPWIFFLIKRPSCNVSRQLFVFFFHLLAPMNLQLAQHFTPEGEMYLSHKLCSGSGSKQGDPLTTPPRMPQSQIMTFKRGRRGHLEIALETVAFLC